MDPVISWSGGKDSALALYKALSRGIKVSSLFTMFSPEGFTMSHRIPRPLLELQARDLGVKIVESAATWASYEVEFKKALASFKEKGVGSCIFGDIDLDDHLNWCRRVCAEVGIQAWHPLNGKTQEQLLQEFLEAGFKARIVVVNLDHLSEEYLGRMVDTELIAEFTGKGISPAGEFGEYHTLVTEGPIFKENNLEKRLKLKQPGVLFNQGYAFWDLEQLVHL